MEISTSVIAPPGAGCPSFHSSAVNSRSGILSSIRGVNRSREECLCHPLDSNDPFLGFPEGRAALRIRLDSVSVSGVLLTISLLSLVPSSLKVASTWKERVIWVTDKFLRYNYESLLAFASLALIIIGITVIWTGYQKRFRSSWFILVVFVCVYFVPVYLLDISLAMRTVGWPWWPELVRQVKAGRPLAQDAAICLITLTLMLIALVLPVRAFFGKKPLLPSGNQSKALENAAGADPAKMHRPAKE